MTSPQQLQFPPKVEKKTRFSTVREVAKVLRVSNMTIYRLINTGALPAYRVGRGMRIPTQAVWDYLHNQRIDPEEMNWVNAL